MIDILTMQCYHFRETGRMFRVVALQTERGIRAVADITLLRVADVLLTGTVARFSQRPYER